MTQQTPAAPLQIPGRFFHCVLDDQPHYLVPARLLPEEIDDTFRRLVVNPRCWFSWKAVPPSEVARCELPSSHFFPGMDMVWVRDPVVGTATPFWLGSTLRDALSSAQPGQAPPTSCSSAIRSVLSCARVLVAPDNEPRWRMQWADTISRCATQFRNDGYVSLSETVHPFHLGALRRYYRYLLRTGGMAFGDSQSRSRYIAHNEPVANFFHKQFTSLVSDIAGTPVKPSYAYVSAYQGGAELPKHTDRAQCEYSITLLIDYSPEPQLESAWPLYLETNNGTVAISQALGDGLVYRGRHIPHYRNRLDAAMTSTSIFFHYVMEDFEASLS